MDLLVSNEKLCLYYLTVFQILVVSFVCLFVSCIT